MNCAGWNLKRDLLVRGCVSGGYLVLIVFNRRHFNNDVAPDLSLQFVAVVVLCKPDLFFNGQSTLLRLGSRLLNAFPFRAGVL
jgi:hypothetical protein